MLFAPGRDRPVDAQQTRVGADEHGEPAQHHAADDEHDQAERQQEAGLGARIEARERALPPRVPFELVRDHVRAARRRRVDPGMAAHREREQRTEQQRGTEQHERDEQSRLLNARPDVVVHMFTVCPLR